MSEVLGTPSVERQGFEPLLLLEGVTKSYDGWSKALDDVSLSVARGEFVSIIGCSGAGKSTLLRCVNRLIDPTQGSVVFDGDDVTHVRGRALRQTRRRIAMVFQHYNLVYRATAIENVLQGRLGYKSAVAGMLGLFSDDAQVIEIGLSIVYLIVPTYITYLFIEILSGAMRGAGDSLIPTIMTLTGVCLLRVFWVTVVVSAHHELKVLLMSYPITWIVTSAMFLVYYLRGKWLKRCIALQNAEN